MVSKFYDPEQKEFHLIIFRLGDEEYAVPIICVQEIIMPQKATKIPKAPVFIEGIINLRGQVIPVIDGNKRFNLEFSENYSSNDARIMVLDIFGNVVGLIVNAVTEVIHLNSVDIEQPPIDLETEENFLQGIGKFQNRLLILIDPEKFLSSGETESIKKLTKILETAQ